MKLKFNKELTTPIEIRLYKQKKSQPSTSGAIDKKIDFFNVSDKHELLYGPVDISEFLDLSCSKTYAITISSDKLLETRSNLFFLSLKQRCIIFAKYLYLKSIFKYKFFYLFLFGKIFSATRVFWDRNKNQKSLFKELIKKN